MKFLYRSTLLNTKNNRTFRSLGLLITSILIGIAPRYYSQVTYSFTNAGATGSVGPTQLQVNSAYLSTNLNGSVTVLGSGIQQFTVPVSGIYRIIAAGSAGGGVINAFGCRGRIVQGDIVLNSGIVLKVLVGQKGVTAGTSTGGGGGSYVSTSTNSLLIVGGGGGGYCTPLTAAAPLSDGAYSNNGQSYTGTSGGGTGGIAGAGGNGAPSGWGGGGGGFIGNGTTANSCANTQGYSFLGGGNGGGTCNNSIGGFGGGGGTHGNTGGGGGGGGYSGGGGSGQTPATSSGGGGGSYQSPNMTGLVNGGFNTGQGYVIITRISGVLISQVSPISCFGQSNAVLSASTTGGTAPYTYTWFPGGIASNSITGLSAGTYTCVSTDAASTIFTSTFSVIEPALLTTTFTQINPTCNNSTNGSFTVFASGGTSPYSYTWSPVGGNSAVVSAMGAGSYTCLVKDANNCSVNQSVTLTQPAPLNLVAFATNTLVCLGSNITLIGSGANTYTWTGGVSNGVPFAPVNSASYIVTGTNANGCIGSAFTSITVIPSPTVTVIGSNTVCSGSAVSFTANGAVTYTWSNLATGSVTIMSPVVSSNYTVYGTGSNGCVVSAIKTIQAIPLPNVNVIASNTVICVGGTLVLSGLGANTYTWTGGVTNAVAFSPVVSNVYTVSGTDLNGCINSATRSITVNALPVLSISGPSVICSGNSAVLTASGAVSYTWNNSGTNSSISVSPSLPTSYSLTGQDANSCFNTASHILLVNPLPTVSVNGGSNTAVCLGNSITLVAGGGVSYTWQPGSIISQTIIVSPNATMIYTVDVSHANGCTKTATQQVLVNTLPTVTINSPTLVCSGTILTMTAGGAATYTWQPMNVTAQSVTTAPTANGVYTVSGTNTNGCTNTTVQSISVNPLPVINISSSHSIICANESATLTGSGGIAYLWNNGGNGTSIIIQPLANMMYTLTGTGTNGCVNTFTFEQAVSPCNGILNQSTESNDQIKIYPNPNNGEFIISGVSDTKLYLMNDLGQLAQVIYIDESESHYITTSQLPSGIYFLVGQKDNYHIRQRIIISK